MTPAKTIATFGEPDVKTGSGLIIYIYDLDDGTKMRLGFGGVSADSIRPPCPEGREVRGHSGEVTMRRPCFFKQAGGQE